MEAEHQAFPVECHHLLHKCEPPAMACEVSKNQTALSRATKTTVALPHFIMAQTERHTDMHIEQDPEAIQTNEETMSY